MSDRKPATADTLEGLTTDAADTQKANEVLAQGRGERPTAQDLAEWLNGDDCPPDVVDADVRASVAVAWI